jgi:hypothetical protein
LTAGASGRKPVLYPAAGDSHLRKRVAGHTPCRRAPCIADFCQRCEKRHQIIDLGLSQRQGLHILIEPRVTHPVTLVVVIHDIPQRFHRPVVEVRPGHKDISHVRRLVGSKIVLLFRNEEAPERRYLALDSGVVDSLQICLRQIAFCLPRQGDDVMAENSDADVMKIVISEDSDIPLFVRQSMAQVAAGLGVEQFPAAFC